MSELVPVGGEPIGMGNMGFGCWDMGIEWCAKEGVGGTPAKTERLWLGLRQKMAGCGVNALGVTYLCGVMWSLDAGIKRRAKEGSWRHPSKIERPWLGFREQMAGGGVNALGGTYLGEG